ncbi:MAG: AAA family ATPase [Clostridia bacterium]|nr:AAA family ATPase [Clostridia bacterium]
MVKEISLGAAIALVVFLLWQGYDVIPILMLAGMGLAVYFIAETKGVLKPVALGNKVTVNPLTFDDIGGQGMAIQELVEALDFMVNQDAVKQLGIRPLKGILLTGPPGTGKTLMAKAAANYTHSEFMATSGSEFIEMYAGVGAQRVRKLFRGAREQAKKNGKRSAIVFIDEIDVVGGKRGRNTSHLEYDQTLNQLLVEMDGMKTDDQTQVLLIAATNRVDMLDPALLRPGRFDRQVKVDLPDRDGRKQILSLHIKNKPVAEDVKLEELAKETFGFSGAQLESLTNEAAIYAMREESQLIKSCHFRDALEKVMLGEKLDRKPNLEDLHRVAVHETGHALLSELVRSGSVSSVTVTPRGQALGYMRQNQEEDSYLYTREYLEDKIAVLLAGALAEETVLGNRSTGSAGDFQQAVDVAKRIILAGMSPLGVVAEDCLTQDVLRGAVAEIITGQEARVRADLEGYHQVMGQVVERLLEEEKLSGEELRNLLKGSVAA